MKTQELRAACARRITTAAGRAFGAVGLLLAALALLGAAAPARATLLVDRPLNPSSGGAYSNLGPANEQKAYGFTLASAVVANTLSWSGRYDGASAPANPVAFSVRFFSDAGGLPATTPLLTYDVTANALDTGLNYGGTIPWYAYSIGLGDLALGSGSYWISIVESDARTPAVGSTQWLWGQTTATGAVAYRNQDGLAWNTVSGFPTGAFTLTGASVPEPSSLSMFATGGAALSWCGWRARRRARA